MTQTLHILAKDLRANRWQIATAAVLAALYIHANTVPPDGIISGFVLEIPRRTVQFLLPLAWALLIASAIQAEPLTGDRAFWLTRPYRRAALITAKSLFILLTVNLPLFLSDIAILTIWGFQPWNHLADFPLRQLWFTILIPLPAAALASITRTLNQFLFAAIAIVAALNSAGYVMPTLYLPLPFEPLLIATTLAAFAAVALWTQYRHRNTRLARACVAAALLLTVAIALTPRDLLAKAESLFAHTSTLQPTLALDPTRQSEFTTRSELAAFDANESLRLPIASRNLPPGYSVHALYANVTFEGLANGPYHSRLFPPTNPQWLKIELPRAIAQQVRTSKPTIHAETKLLLLRHVDTERHPTTAPFTSELGACMLDPRYRRLQCLVPFWVHRFTTRLTVNRATEASSGFGYDERHWSLLSPIASARGGDANPDTDLVLTTVQPIARTQTKFDLPLADPIP